MAENSQKTARRGPGRRFQPGESGNPGGRPRKTPEQREIEELARCYSVEAMNRLKDIALYGKDSDSVRACEAILESSVGADPAAHAAGRGGQAEHQARADFVEAKVTS